MIPKIIWQTYKDDLNKTSIQLQKSVKTWKVQNRDYKHKYYNDQEAAKLILEEYGKEWHDIFTSVPIGVVRGDIFRYLVLYRFGGVYSDVDTICKLPINDWINGPSFDLQDRDAVFSAELMGHGSRKEDRVCQWTFAAKAEMDIFKNVIDNVKDRLLSIDWDSVTDVSKAVHDTTGPDIFSYSILEAMGFAKQENKIFSVDKNINLLENVDYINKSQYAIDNKIFIYGNDLSGMFNRKAVMHLYAGSSEKWNDGTYVQWKKQTIQ